MTEPTYVCVRLGCTARGASTSETRCAVCGTPTEPGDTGIGMRASMTDAELVARYADAEGPTLIVTTNEIAGHAVKAVHGDVFGLVVMSRNLGSNIGAGLRSLAGGEIVAYTELLEDSRNIARRRMWAHAVQRGGNAVVAFRFDCNSLGETMSEVAAYGTAVTVERLPATPAG